MEDCRPRRRNSGCRRRYRPGRSGSPLGRRTRRWSSRRPHQDSGRNCVDRGHHWPLRGNDRASQADCSFGTGPCSRFRNTPRPRTRRTRSRWHPRTTDHFSAAHRCRWSRRSWFGSRTDVRFRTSRSAWDRRSFGRCRCCKGRGHSRPAADRGKSPDHHRCVACSLPSRSTTTNRIRCFQDSACRSPNHRRGRCCRRSWDRWLGRRDRASLSERRCNGPQTRFGRTTHRHRCMQCCNRHHPRRTPTSNRWLTGMPLRWRSGRTARRRIPARPRTWRLWCTCWRTGWWRDRMCTGNRFGKPTANTAPCRRRSRCRSRDPRRSGPACTRFLARRPGSRPCHHKFHLVRRSRACWRHNSADREACPPREPRRSRRASWGDRRPCRFRHKPKCSKCRPRKSRSGTHYRRYRVAPCPWIGSPRSPCPARRFREWQARQGHRPRHRRISRPHQQKRPCRTGLSCKWQGKHLHTECERNADRPSLGEPNVHHFS